MPGFVDEAQVHVKAGNGGAGAVSYRREAHVSRGGPDGGNGGRGGNVFLEAGTSAVSLIAFKDHPHRRGGDGTHGSGSRRHGKNGDDLVVSVPLGTIVRDADGAVLADLQRPGDSLLAAEGGRGGRGNAYFASNRLRAPAFAEQAELGGERWLDLELKLIADVALVGFPNAGKSTLISTVSAAKPKIADYPFTTLEPHLGVVRVGGRNSGTSGDEFVIADIPGLIEGASDGKGLGHQFLRHIERSRALVYLVDLSPGATHQPAEQLVILRRELATHRADLADRPYIVVGSRSDLREQSDGEPAPGFGADLEISAVTRAGLTDFVNRVARLVDTERREHPELVGTPVLHRPEARGIVVSGGDGRFVVEGREALWAVGLSDLNDADALALVERRMKRLGITRALRRAGARDGDSVSIGRLEFDFVSDE